MEGKEKRLVCNCGQGYHYSKRIGKFEVKSNGGTKEFTKLSDAKKYYDSLDCEKAIWDVSVGADLIECHLYEK